MGILEGSVDISHPMLSYSSTTMIEIGGEKNQEINRNDKFRTLS